MTFQNKKKLFIEFLLDPREYVCYIYHSDTLFVALQERIMQKPKSGIKARGSRTGRPIMAILDLLGRRWALRVLWELHLNSPASFRALRNHCDEISPTVLNSRLRELREAGIIEHLYGRGYVITGQGMALGRIIEELNVWSSQWAAGIKPGRDRLRGKKSSPEETALK